MNRDVPERDAASDVAFDRHYSISEVAAMLGISYRAAVNLLHNQPGVLEFGRDEGLYRMPYKVRRVPESVLARIQRQICTGVVPRGGAKIDFARGAQSRIYRKRSVHIPIDWRQRCVDAVERERVIELDRTNEWLRARRGR